MQNRKFLFTVWPIPGHFYPTIAIGRALSARGHEVAFYTGSRACGLIRQEGFRCFPFRQLDEEQIYRILFSDYRSPRPWQRARQYQTMLRKWLLETIPGQIADLQELCSSWQPEVLISDPTVWGPILILQETLRIPVAIASFVPCCMLPGPDAPPFGPGLPPPRTWYFRLLSKIVRTLTDIYGKKFRDAASEIRRHYGLAPLRGSVTEHTGSASLYLVPCSPEFDYRRKDLPLQVQYVGPCLWNKPFDQHAPDWLATLRTDQPWVHVTEGTVHVDKPLVLRAAAQGLANLHLQVIMTAGGNRNPAELELGPIAPNVHLADWIPHSDLLSRTDVLVTTGGAGTVLAALSAGVPLVIVPTEWDKPEIARRVVEAGAGIRIAPWRCTPKRLRAAVETILATPAFKENVRNVQNSFARYGGPAQAACLLEKIGRPQSGDGGGAASKGQSFVQMA